MIKKVLLYYKKSSYEIYFLRKKSPLYTKNKKLLSSQINHFKSAHNNHYNSLQVIEQVLRSKNIKYNKCVRGKKDFDFSPYDLVITIGGDGTFLEAARFLKNKLMLGVNSCPELSVGNLCSASLSNFNFYIEKILNNNVKIKELCRLQITMQNFKNPIYFLNDILVAHLNPAAMSRYSIRIGRTTEEHRSSGLWVSTPSGSTGAIHSAGGRIMPKFVQKIQYLSRELYASPGFKYKLKKGIIDEKSSVEIVSLMRNGRIFVDGAHCAIPFCLGSKATISVSPYPTKILF